MRREARGGEKAAGGRALEAVLGVVERAGNRLPDPATLFLMLATLVLVASWLAARLGISAVHPVTGKTISVVDLLSRDGVRSLLTGIVANFTGFAPLGTVLTVMLGIGIAERSGLLAALLKAMVTAVPPRFLTPAVLLASFLSHVAADAGYVVLTPLVAYLWATVGRHPLAGVAVVFAGVAGGYAANLVIGPVDALLAGMTQEAARLLAPGYVVQPTANYFVLAASVILLTGVGWFVADRIVEPRLGPWRPSVEVPLLAGLDGADRRGLVLAALAAVATTGAVLLLALPAGAPLRDPTTGDLSPLWNSLVALLMIGFALAGLAFGCATGSVRSDRDAARMMAEAMATMGSYVVLAFFAGQFIAWFRQSELGLILAVHGARLLRAVHLTGAPLMVGFVGLTALIDLFMASASAKWAAMGPVFVPMLMTLGWSPEVTQALYRVGDSVMNCVTPLNPYFPIVIVAVRRWVPDVGLGTLLAAMLPFALAFGLSWAFLVIVWVMAGLPPGPGAPLHWPPT